jgi:hypothetical protein
VSASSCMQRDLAAHSLPYSRRQAISEEPVPVRVVSKPKGVVSRAHKVIDLESDDDTPQVLPPKTAEVINLSDR